MTPTPPKPGQRPTQADDLRHDGPDKKTPDPSSGQTQVEQDQNSSPRLPHERDESADSQTPPDGKPTELGRQAHQDVKRGLVDTDRGPVLEKLNKKLDR